MNRIIPFFIISILIHIFIFFYIYKWLFSFQLYTEKIDTKRIEIQIAKNITPESLLQNNKSTSFYHAFESTYQKDDTIDDNLIFNNNISKPVYKTPSKKFKHQSYNYQEIENTEINDNEIYQSEKFDDEFIKEFSELEQIENDAIQFESGNKRELIDTKLELLKEIAIFSSTNCKISLTIDKNGSILNAEILKSTGDLNNDKKILTIVKEWKFEEGEQTQNAVVNLNYILK